MSVTINPASSTSILDLISKVATIIIALFNTAFAIYIFFKKYGADKVEKECDRKMQLLKTLILDHNLKNLYTSFENLDLILKGLKNPSLQENDKKIIEQKMQEIFIEFRINFYDVLSAVDNQLYSTIRDLSDALQGMLTESIFDSGVNLNHEPKYKELISERIAESKLKIIRCLFEYRG